jgi:TnpA family transposase
MPRRRALICEQLVDLFALPAVEADLVCHWTLGAGDFAAIERRRGGANQLGFALQLCAFRHPGRLLRQDEAIPEAALEFIASQLGIGPRAPSAYAA